MVHTGMHLSFPFSFPSPQISVLLKSSSSSPPPSPSFTIIFHFYIIRPPHFASINSDISPKPFPPSHCSSSFFSSPIALPLPTLPLLSLQQSPAKSPTDFSTTPLRTPKCITSLTWIRSTLNGNSFKRKSKWRRTSRKSSRYGL